MWTLDLCKSYFRLTLKWFRSNKTKTTNEHKYKKMILLSNRQKRAPFGWFSISRRKKNSLKSNFPQLGATETILGISFLSYGLRPRFWPFFKVSGKSLCCYWSDKFDFIRIFLALIRKVLCKPKIQWGKFVRSQFLFETVLTRMSSVSYLLRALVFCELGCHFRTLFRGFFPQTHSYF